MTREEVVALVRQAVQIDVGYNTWTISTPHLEEFARLVAAAERERLAQPEQEPVRLQCTTCGTVYADGVPPQVPEQEPVAWGMRDMNGHIYDCISVEEHGRAEGDYNVPLYTTPPRREWVGLEPHDMPDGEDPIYDDPHFIAGMVWAAKKLMEKNG